MGDSGDAVVMHAKEIIEQDTAFTLCHCKPQADAVADLDDQDAHPRGT